MTWHEHHCWSVTCDVCDAGWFDDNSPPHFETRDKLEAYAKRYGWVITPLRAVCGFCTPEEACGAAGHNWNPWKFLGRIVFRDGSIWVGRMRTCRDCTAEEYDPPAS